jgi:CBS domain-containing protein
MPPTVNELMTHDPRTVSPDDALTDAARFMREDDIGAVVVARDRSVEGIITDRDIVVRAVADGRDPASTKVADVETPTPVTVTPDTEASEAARLMREHDVRRLVVVQDNGGPVGIVSIGDLAIALDDESALADISADPPNN